MGNIREPIPGSYQDRITTNREGIKNYQQKQGGLITVRRVLMAAGAGLLAIVIAKGGIGNNEKNSTESSSPISTPSEIFNPERTKENILRDNPDAKIRLGSKLDLRFTEGPGGDVFPHIRTGADVVSSHTEEMSNAILLYDIKQINGTAVDLIPGVKLEISDFTSVEGYDADYHSAYGGEWSVVELTKDDGSIILGYISLSNQTQRNWQIESANTPVSLKNLNKLPDDFNKVKIISTDSSE